MESINISNSETDCSKTETTSVETDPYFYTKRNEFTSELYKIEIGNLPQWFGLGQLKKILNNKLKLNAHKIKPVGHKQKYVFVSFRCEEDRSKALDVLKDYKWKGKVLTVKKANPASDPLVKKRNQEDEQQGGPDAKKQKQEENIDVHTRIKNATTPLWNVPYEKQLKQKETVVNQVLEKLGKDVGKLFKKEPSWLVQAKGDHKGLCCELAAIRGSPVTENYRNKCEFTAGQGESSDPAQRIVGFRLARYAAGSMQVAPVDQCVHISDVMKRVVQSFQTFVQSSSKDVYNPELHTGYWRQLTVRSTKNGDVMLIVVIHPQNLSQNELTELKDDIKSYFFSGEGNNCGVTSLYFQTFAKRSADEIPPTEHVHGEQFIEETLLQELKFRISPAAFFQVNTAAAEVLYTQVGELANLTKETTLLDVCCGTGTIGICLAKKVKKVVGVEMVESAVQDAKINIQINEIDNMEVICGKVENVLHSAIASANDRTNIVAIVDPPRAGLHSKVIKTLRSCEGLNRLVYVSCDPRAASTNFVDLCRPSSNQYQGEPFVPVKAVPVDLFPHTNHCELVIVFTRGSNSSSQDPAADDSCAEQINVTSTDGVTPDETQLKQEVQ